MAERDEIDAGAEPYWQMIATLKSSLAEMESDVVREMDWMRERHKKELDDRWHRFQATTAPMREQLDRLIKGMADLRALQLPPVVLMSEPRRVQLSRKKGWKMPENTVKVDRTSVFGNPVTCSWPYGCPHSPDFEREAWTHDDGTISPLRCCVDAYRHIVETGIKGEPTRTGYLSVALDAMEGYPRRTKLVDNLPRLRGKNLACWCDGKPCHADVLLELANAPEEAP